MTLIESVPTITSRQILLDLRKKATLSASTSIVYIYFLNNRKIDYPKGRSNVLYIGEALRDSEPTGKRFGQHITPSQTTGADTGSNLTLSQYFYNHWPIGLHIYESLDCIEDERDLIYTHIDLFGSPPIAQSKTPIAIEGNRTTHIYAHLNNILNEPKIEACKVILNQINTL